MKVKNQKYLDTFGENLKVLLEKKGLKPSDVAAIGGIESKSVYRAINAEHSTTLSVLAAIAKGLGMHPKELLNFDFNLEDSE